MCMCTQKMYGRPVGVCVPECVLRAFLRDFGFLCFLARPMEIIKTRRDMYLFSTRSLSLSLFAFLSVFFYPPSSFSFFFFPLVEKKKPERNETSSGLSAGMAIGIVGDAGVRAVGQQERLFVGMILILIFAEALGLYGMIVALILSQSAYAC